MLVRRSPIDATTIVAGLDCSSVKLAAYWIGLDGWGQGWQAWVMTDKFIGPESAHIAMKCMLRFANKLCSLKRPVIAYVEQPVLAGARNIQTTIKQSIVNGGVLAGLVEGGVRVVPTSINEWKQTFTGYGNASKEEVSKRVEKIWPDSVNKLVTTNGRIDQDLHDAYGICWHGTRRITSTKRLVAPSALRRTEH